MFGLLRIPSFRPLVIAVCLSLLVAAGRSQSAQPGAAPPGGDHGSGAGALRCDVPPGLVPAPGRLANAGRALHRGGHLDILAVGSALVGPHLGADEAFPRRMLELLRGLEPGVTIQLDMRSDRGATAAELVPILRTELTRHPYQLVLWQTGTVDAARKLRPDDFARALDAGLRLAREKGSDVVLIDPQFSRLLEQRADVAPFEARIEQGARSDGAALFPRLALMQYWVESGAVDVEKAPLADRRTTIARLHECLADALAHAIVAGAAAPSGPASSAAE